MRDGKRVGIREHRWAMEQKIGRRLRYNEVVHHADGDRANNAPENLELVARGDHQRTHNLERWEKIKMSTYPGCLHELTPLALTERPYRYECRKCGKRLKIASGVKVSA